MPHLFRLREDNCFFGSLKASVAVKYNHGFTANPQGIYFTTSRRRVSPSSVLIEKISEFNPGQQILLSKNELLIGSLRFEPSENIKLFKHSGYINKNILKTNNKKIENCLMLFGKDSLITELFFNPHRKHNKLSTNIDQICKKARNLTHTQQFCGYGTGLTPSFDDFISGMLLTDRYYNRNKILLTASYLKTLYKKTTQVSCQQIMFCNMGVLNTAFEQFLYKICQTEIKSHEILKLLNFGHTSGTDILCGISAYLKYFRLV